MEGKISGYLEDGRGGAFKCDVMNAGGGKSRPHARKERSDIK
jgi:hypothetical protein